MSQDVSKKIKVAGAAVAVLVGVGLTAGCATENAAQYSTAGTTKMKTHCKGHACKGNSCKGTMKKHKGASCSGATNRCKGNS